MPCLCLSESILGAWTTIGVYTPCTKRQEARDSPSALSREPCKFFFETTHDQPRIICISIMGRRIERKNARTRSHGQLLVASGNQQLERNWQVIDSGNWEKEREKRTTTFHALIICKLKIGNER